MSDAEMEGPWLYIVPTNGGVFAAGNNTITLTPEVYEKRQLLNLTDKNPSYYWFREDIDIDVGSDGYLL
jgi:hypothetical protein